MALCKGGGIYVFFLFLTLNFYLVSTGVYIRQKTRDPEIIDLNSHLKSRDNVLKFRGDTNLFRKRRSATSGESISENLAVNITHLKDKNHNQAVVHWSGENSKVIFVLTRLRLPNGNVSSSTLWRSTDYGSHFDKVSFHPENPVISFFYVSPADKNKLLFNDRTQNRIYYTTDEGVTMSSSNPLQFQPDRLLFHPSKSDMIIGYSYASSELYVTTDFTKTWTRLHQNVNPLFFWSIKNVDTDSDVIHMEMQNPTTAESFYKTCNPPNAIRCQNKPAELIGTIDYGSLAVQDEYIFVQKTDDYGSKLFVSYNRNSFREAHFPPGLATQDFTVVDTSEHQVFIAVNHVNVVNVYNSDSSGRFFVLSLDNVVAIRTPFAGFDVDLYEISSMPGAYIANQYVSTDLSDLRQRTKISFDKGGNWQLINAPSKRYDGSAQICASADVCSLHIHMAYSNWQGGIPMLLSNEKAPGIIMAHGVVGAYLSSQLAPNVFMSRDGGITWTELFLNLHKFSILDQGGALVAVQYVNSTNKIMYSCTEGHDWKTFTFHNQSITIDGMLNEPGINTLVASIYGHANYTQGWLIAKVDFSSILNLKCLNSDYEDWYPSDQFNNRECILGEKLKYERRKQMSLCYNGQDYSRSNETSSCKCEMEDFECDFGFTCNNAHAHVATWFDQTKPYGDCPEGSSYNVSHGYRKVASDKCSGGVEHLYIPRSVACPIQKAEGLEITTDHDKLVIPTGIPVTFHLVQTKGSKVTTTYVWDYGDATNVTTVVGYAKASNQTHAYFAKGPHTVKVTATNKMGSSQQTITVKIEDAITAMYLEEPYGARVNMSTSFSVSVSSAFVKKAAVGQAHFVWDFGENSNELPLLTWSPAVNHTYNKSGDYVVTLEGINAVSSMFRRFVVRVYGNVSTVQLSFASEADSYYQDTILWRARLSTVLQTAIVAKLTIPNKARVEVSVLPGIPLKADVCFVPEIQNSTTDVSIDKWANYLVDLVKGGFSVNLAGRKLDITNAKIIVEASIPAPATSHMVAVYIAVPVLLVAVLMVVLIVWYYKKKLGNMRRYSMLRNRPHAESLLDDDDDDPPLDPNPDFAPGVDNVGDNQMEDGEGHLPTLVMMTNTGNNRDNNASDNEDW